MITPLFPGAALLVPHPDSAPAPLSLIQVTLGRGPEGALVLDYRLQGDLGALRLPSAAAPAPADRLWAHTCCEVFLRRSGSPTTAGASATAVPTPRPAPDPRLPPRARPYREFNFSPSGQWASYGFAAYRLRDPEAPLPPAPRLEVQGDAGELRLRATLEPGALPPGSGVLQVALATVVERQDGSLAYWALAHGAGQPDFHGEAGFVLALPPDF